MREHECQLVDLEGARDKQGRRGLSRSGMPWSAAGRLCPRPPARPPARPPRQAFFRRVDSVANFLPSYSQRVPTALVLLRTTCKAVQKGDGTRHCIDTTGRARAGMGMGMGPHPRALTR